MCQSIVMDPSGGIGRPYTHRLKSHRVNGHKQEQCMAEPLEESEDETHVFRGPQECEGRFRIYGDAALEPDVLYARHPNDQKNPNLFLPVDHSGRWESAVFGDQLDELFTVLQRLGACSVEQEVEGDETSSSSDDDDESIECAPADYQVAARIKRIAEERMNRMRAELEMAGPSTEILHADGTGINFTSVDLYWHNRDASWGQMARLRTDKWIEEYTLTLDHQRHPLAEPLPPRGEDKDIGTQSSHLRLSYKIRFYPKLTLGDLFAAEQAEIEHLYKLSNQKTAAAKQANDCQKELQALRKTLDDTKAHAVLRSVSSSAKLQQTEDEIQDCAQHAQALQEEINALDRELACYQNSLEKARYKRHWGFLEGLEHNEEKHRVAISKRDEELARNEQRLAAMEKKDQGRLAAMKMGDEEPMRVAAMQQVDEKLGAAMAEHYTAAKAQQQKELAVTMAKKDRELEAAMDKIEAEYDRTKRKREAAVAKMRTEHEVAIAREKWKAGYGLFD
eukprot:g1809.t1